MNVLTASLLPLIMVAILMLFASYAPDDSWLAKWKVTPERFLTLAAVIAAVSTAGYASFQSRSMINQTSAMISRIDFELSLKDRDNAVATTILLGSLRQLENATDLSVEEPCDFFLISPPPALSNFSVLRALNSPLAASKVNGVSEIAKTISFKFAQKKQYAACLSATEDKQAKMMEQASLLMLELGELIDNAREELLEELRGENEKTK